MEAEEFHMRKCAGRGGGEGKEGADHPQGLVKPDRNFCLACLTYFTSECFSANAFSGTHAAISWMPSSSTRASTLARIIPISRFYIPAKFLSFITFAFSGQGETDLRVN